MSEYLVLIFTACPQFATGEYVSDFAQIRDEVDLRLREVTTEALENYGFPLAMEYENDEADYQGALDTVETLFNIYFVNEHDETEKISIDGSRHYIVAGGMTRDQDPSDAYRDLLPLANMEIFERPFGMGDQLAV